MNVLNSPFVDGGAGGGGGTAPGPVTGWAFILPSYIAISLSSTLGIVGEIMNPGLGVCAIDTAV
jgi:hypothetical protein